MDSTEKYELLLTQLLLMFQTAALQHMGKLKNPLTDKIERDLQQAQISIDMIEMLCTKMKGNLTPEEEKMFSQMLQDLRLNYVDEVSKTESGAHQQSSPTAQTPTQS
ncbi:MAG: DUF1844 domain-containing protein [Ignavibacteriae bacterium]|nr:DUF1844 domain-containing protein [Ignavibacteriota bacterium]